MSKERIINIILTVTGILWVLGLVGVILIEIGLEPGQGVGLMLFLYAGFSVIIVLPFVSILRVIARRMKEQEGNPAQNSSWQKVLHRMLYIGLGLVALWLIGGAVLNTAISAVL